MTKKQMREHGYTETELTIDKIEINVIHRDTDILEIHLDGNDITTWLTDDVMSNIEYELEKAIINEDEIDQDKAYEHD